VSTAGAFKFVAHAAMRPSSPRSVSELHQGDVC
jgi:hypothetical protein